MADPREAWRCLTTAVLAGALAVDAENYEMAVESMRELIDEFPAERLLEDPDVTVDELATASGDYLQRAQAELERLLGPERKRVSSLTSSSTGR